MYRHHATIDHSDFVSNLCHFGAWIAERLTPVDAALHDEAPTTGRSFDCLPRGDDPALRVMPTAAAPFPQWVG
jgi:hypothetical protein